jgi:hypothetical protein
VAAPIRAAQSFKPAALTNLQLTKGE